MVQAVATFIGCCNSYANFALIGAIFTSCCNFYAKFLPLLVTIITGCCNLYANFVLLGTISGISKLFQLVRKKTKEDIRQFALWRTDVRKHLMIFMYIPYARRKPIPLFVLWDVWFNIGLGRRMF